MPFLTNPKAPVIIGMFMTSERTRKESNKGSEMGEYWRNIWEDTKSHDHTASWIRPKRATQTGTRMERYKERK